jgi:hypothetical protein
MKKSRLAGALETRKKINEAEHGPERATTPAPPATLEAEPNSEPKRKPAAKKRSIARKRAEPPPAPPIKRGVGRPPGKRSSEDYPQRHYLHSARYLFRCDECSLGGQKER